MGRLDGLPPAERPRERLLREGVEALSTPELMAIVLGSGTRGRSVLELSQDILMHFGTLERLIDASIVELTAIKGIGHAKAIQLKSVFGLAARCQRLQSEEKTAITTPAQAYQLARSEIAHCKQEVLLVILRDVRGYLIHQEKVSVGTLSHVLVHPREVFYPAVRYKAHSLIIAHNHPSGDPTPSNADLELTRALLHAGRVMGIGLDDHLIVCSHQFLSLKELGHIPATRSSGY